MPECDRHLDKGYVMLKLPKNKLKWQRCTSEMYVSASPRKCPSGHSVVKVNGRTDTQTVANSIVPLPHFVRRETKSRHQESITSVADKSSLGYA